MSSVLIYGGAALEDVPQEVADRSIRLALGAGVNHIDTAADYGDSEIRIGPWMRRIRREVFLATKTGDRAAGGAYDSIRRSLERLRVERVDLIQLHAVCDMQDLDRVTGTGGALEGALQAREEGLVGAIGITGHGMKAPVVHLEALRRFPFDTVLTPFNYRLSLDPGFARDFEALVEETQAQDAGLMLIKAVARNLWRVGEEPRFTTWYKPLDEQGAIDAAVAFALSRQEVTGICTPGDVELLPMLIDAERRGGGISREAAAARLADVSELEPPFVRVEGREVPDWLEPLISESPPR